jgi:serralysin
MSENESHYCMCQTQGNLPPEAQAVLAQGRAAVMKHARWQPGDTIKIRFFSGSPELQGRVRTIANEWTKFANLRFQFVSNAPSDIRIAFFQDTRDDSSWSRLGTECRSIAEPRPTMNFGRLTDAPTDHERRTVLHEFGHAIGLIHEHQNPTADRPIAWNKAAVIADCSKPPNSWTYQQIEDNIFKPYNPRDVLGTDRDPLSIMLYPIPKSWTTDGFSREMNRELSAEDKRLVQYIYPR